MKCFKSTYLDQICNMSILGIQAIVHVLVQILCKKKVCKVESLFSKYVIIATIWILNDLNCPIENDYLNNQMIESSPHFNDVGSSIPIGYALDGIINRDR